MAAARSLGRIVPKNSSVFLCDMQEKFRPNIAHFDKIVFNSNRILHAAKVMQMPVMVTEQYPKGLGHTVKDIELEKYGIKPFEKTCFTMVIPEVKARYNSGCTLFRNNFTFSGLNLFFSSCQSCKRSRVAPPSLSSYAASRPTRASTTRPWISWRRATWMCTSSPTAALRGARQTG
jgi:hypothetical protein